MWPPGRIDCVPVNPAVAPTDVGVSNALISPPWRLLGATSAAATFVIAPLDTGFLLFPLLDGTSDRSSA